MIFDTRHLIEWDKIRDSKIPPVVIFCFNRARFLQHAIENWKKFAPKGPIFIFDDASDSKDMVALLSSLRADPHITAIYVSTQTKGELFMSRGGLYDNMQEIFSDFMRNGVDWVIFTQDDMQLLRPMSKSYIDDLKSCIELNENLWNIEFRFSNKKEDTALQDEHWFRTDKYPVAINRGVTGYSSFIPVGIYSLEKAKSANWKFLNSERATNDFARNAKLVFGKSLTPIAAHMPKPVTFTRRKRPVSTIVFDLMRGYGFHPLKELDEEKIEVTKPQGLSLPSVSGWAKLQSGKPVVNHDAFKSDRLLRIFFSQF